LTFKLTTVIIKTYVAYLISELSPGSPVRPFKHCRSAGRCPWNSCNWVHIATRLVLMLYCVLSYHGLSHLCHTLSNCNLMMGSKSWDFIASVFNFSPWMFFSEIKVCSCIRTLVEHIEVACDNHFHRICPPQLLHPLAHSHNVGPRIPNSVSVAKIAFYIVAKTWFNQLKNLSNAAVSSRIGHILNPCVGLYFEVNNFLGKRGITHTCEKHELQNITNGCSN